jgi:SAM-dependent methyltransferase
MPPPYRRLVNRFHLWYCQSARWTRAVEGRLLPWVLSDVDLGDAVLELGPGLGVTTRVLARRTAALTALELDPMLVSRLRSTLPAVTVVHGDATAMSLPDNAFSAVVCFTMLHHLPSAEAQDRLFAEALRVLRPGGVFAGSDSRLSLRMRLYHVADTMTTISADALAERLARAGFTDVSVGTSPRSNRFRARKPGAPSR